MIGKGSRIPQNCFIKHYFIFQLSKTINKYVKSAVEFPVVDKV